MRFAIGLPNAIPGVPGRLVLDWARRAEIRGFYAVASIDRLVYSNIEPLTALTAAASVTEHIDLFTDILLAPLRPTALLAKQAASLAALAPERLTLGLAPGGREDDYVAAGASFGTRGRRFDAQLARLQEVWAGEPLPGTERPLGPRPFEGAIPLLIGGTSDATIRRVVQYGAGWTAGSGATGVLESLADRVRAAWAAGGREGAPRMSTLAYFALGDASAVEAAAGPYLTDYYGAERGAMVMANMVRSEAALATLVERCTAAGIGELVLFPAVGDLEQVDRLADLAC